MYPPAYRYAKTHEWAKLDGEICTVGITQYAVDLLTDVTYIKLPKLGTKVSAEKSFGEIESVKAVSDLYAPVDGVVVEVNKQVENDPASIATDPYEKGWVVRIKVAPGTKLDRLQTAADYEKQIASEGH